MRPTVGSIANLNSPNKVCRLIVRVIKLFVKLQFPSPSSAISGKNLKVKMEPSLVIYRDTER